MPIYTYRFYQILFSSLSCRCLFSYSTAGGGKPLFRSSGGKNGLPGAYLAFSNIALDFISSLVGKPKCFDVDQT